MKFILSKDKFEISEKEDLTSGSISYYEIPVETDEEWEGLDIEAVIIEANAEKGVGKAVINNKVFIDRTISGSYLIGFRGYKIKNNEKTYQISTKLKQIKFKKGAGEVELQNDEDLPSLSEWEIYISEIQDMITQVQTSTTIATTQAGIATTKANEASTSAANAQTSAEKAEESAASVEQIVSDFEDNAENKTTAFNTNATNKTTSYNNNATQKTDIFNSNATTKTNEFNEIVVNAEQDISDMLEEIDAKINSFNNNATQKTTEYNNNTEEKLNTYNENATTKISNYNNNAVEKLQDYNNNAEEKITEFNNQLKQQYYTKEEIEKVLDTNEVEGTEIHIEDAKEFNILDFIVDGKSEQAGEPTPDNPIEIENIEGKNKFNYKKLTPTFNINGDEKEFTITAPNVGTTVYEYTGFKTSKQYTLSGFYSSTSLDGVFRIKYSDNTYTAIKAIYDGSAVSKTKFSVTSTVNKTIVSIQFILYGNTYDLTFYDFQIEEGTVATRYVPYNSLEFKVEGKNLFDINKRLQGTINSDGDLKISYNLNKFYEYDFKENTQYTFSAYIKNENEDKGNVRFKIVYKDGTEDGVVLLNRTTIYEYITYTSKLNKTIDYISIIYSTAGTMYIKNGELQIEEGTQATPYEPYKSQVVTFPLGEEKLMEGSYLADDGIHHSRKQVVFDGSDDEWWLLYSAYNSNGGIGYCYQIENASFALGNNTSICSHFKNVSTAYMPSTGYVGAYCDHLTVYRKYFISDKSTLAEWKAWLSNNPITVEYDLAEPEVVPFTAEQQEAWNKIKALKTFKGVNNIRVDTNLGLTNAKVTYAQDLKKRLEKIEEAIVAMGGVE